MGDKSPKQKKRQAKQKHQVQAQAKRSRDAAQAVKAPKKAGGT